MISLAVVRSIVGSESGSSVTATASVASWDRPISKPIPIAKATAPAIKTQYWAIKASTTTAMARMMGDNTYKSLSR